YAKADPYNEALRLIVLALYQAAAEEFARRYRYLAERSPNRDALEMAAQLRIALDGAPSLSALRFFWQKMGAIRRGVTSQNHNDQGMRELIALSSASDAYRSCIGQVTVTQTGSTNASLRREFKLESNARAVKELTQGLVSLLGGAAVGVVSARSGA